MFVLAIKLSLCIKNLIHRISIKTGLTFSPTENTGLIILESKGSRTEMLEIIKQRSAEQWCLNLLERGQMAAPRGLAEWWQFGGTLGKQVAPQCNSKTPLEAEMQHSASPLTWLLPQHDLPYRCSSLQNLYYTLTFLFAPSSFPFNV